MNISRPAIIYTRVRHFRNILFALAAFLWLPVSAHCQLEALTGLEFLTCQVDSNCHGKPASSPDASGCCSVEKSQYHQTAQLRVTLAPPALVPETFPPLVLPAAAPPAEVSLGLLTAAPPQLRPTWQFASRTALPVRAPAVAS